MTTEFNKEDFDAAVQAAVEEALSSRDEEKARLEAEEALREAKETFEVLKASIEAKDTKIKEYEEALANMDNVDPSEAEVLANERIVALEQEVDKLTHRANVAEAALDTIAREEAAAGRMAELQEAGVALEDAAAEIQYAKVREMSDEEFSSYREELVALKSMYFSASDEEEETTEVAELDESEVSIIAQSLGCDPADAKCISLVREVAQRVAEVSNTRNREKETEKNQESAEENKIPAQNKEVASKLSLSEAISKSVNQEIQVPSGLREEISQAWEAVIAERRGENKSD